MSRDALLTKYEEKWKNCQLCRLKKYRTRVVFGQGRGSAPYKLLIIGDAPGTAEDDKGAPFCGRTGALLGGIARKLQIPSRGIYLSNLCGCRPPENRPPLYDEIQACHSRLKTIVLLTDPRVILLLGGSAMTAVMGKGKVTQMRGKWRDSVWKFPERGKRLTVPAIGTYHPSHALRDPSVEPLIEKDMEAAWQRTNEGA